MKFTVERMAGQHDLYTRPRVSHKISEYVFSFINEKILKPNRIMQSDKFIFKFVLYFLYGIPPNHKIIYKSPYSTSMRLYVPQTGFRTFEKLNKYAHLSVVVDDINEHIAPADYASVVYRMFADYFLFNYSKLNKEIFDRFETELDYKHIESFPFPATYDEQLYIQWENEGIKRQKYIAHFGN